MQIIAINGSPNGARGNTAALLRHVLDGAAQEGATCNTVHLSDVKVLPCTACNACHKHGTCPQPDAYEATKRRIQEADGLVLASPNHIFNVSAQMKAFMDRSCGVIHCASFEGSYGAAVVTSGAGEEQAVADYMSRFLIATGVVPVGSVWATMGERPQGDIPGEVRNRAVDLGRSLVRACQDRPSFPAAEESIRAFRARMSALVARHEDEWPYEYEYWKALHDMV